LFKQNTLGVIVNNAQTELLDWHRDYGHPRRIHYAEATCAAGMLEGIKKLQPDLFEL
jgi:Sucrose-6F-phosphate phosphohydrolase